MSKNTAKNPSQEDLDSLLEHYQNARYEDAEKLALSITRKFPDHPLSWTVLGVMLEQIGRAPEALNANLKAVQLTPQAADAHYNLANTLRSLDRLEEAEASYMQALALAPEDAEIYYNLGVTLGMLGRLEEAEKSYRQATVLNSDYADAYNSLGMTFYSLGRLEDAATSYRQLVALQPDYAEAHANLGIALEELGILEEAEASFRQALDLKPDLAVAHDNLGVTLQKLGRLEEAATSYRQLITLQPDNAEAHNNLGTMLQNLGRFEGAETSYRQAVVLKPDLAVAHYNLGVTLQKLGRLEEAEASCRQALGLEPDSVEIYINLGITLRRLGRLEEAEASYRQALVLQSNSAEAHNCLGVTLQELGRLDEAEASYGQALALQSDYAEALKNLGVLLLESGQFKKTVTFYQDNKNKNKNSQTHLLKCFYELDDRIQFYKQLDFLIEKGEVNPTIGSLTSRAENRYGIRKINTFAIEPFKYVVRTDLIKKCDFKNTFVEAMHNILNKESLSIRNQGLLSKGQQTAGNIFLIDTDLIRKVEKIIRSGIGDYQAKFKNSKEGFLVAWPKKYSLKGWLISMKSGGHLAPHIHEAGWLSGAVYINVPAKKQPDSGNFVLCTDAAEPKKMDEKNGHKVIDIATGDLVLFPASLMHYTIPFESEEQRIVLAFDVMPE